MQLKRESWMVNLKEQTETESVVSCIAQGQLSALGWPGRVGRREAQEGRDVCILIPDSRCYTAETNTTL